MIASATQVGPGRWAARLHANGVCVYSEAVNGDEAAALQRAQDEIEARSAAIAQARAIARLEVARARALPMLVRLVSAPIGQTSAVIDEAREMLDGIDMQLAAE